jgi:hypothetical protein
MKNIGTLTEVYHQSLNDKTGEELTKLWTRLSKYKSSHYALRFFERKNSGLIFRNDTLQVEFMELYDKHFNDKHEGPAIPYIIFAEYLNDLRRLIYSQKSRQGLKY